MSVREAARAGKGTGNPTVTSPTAAEKEAVGVYAEARGRPVFTLKEFAGEPGDIGDPATQGEDVFRACRDEIKGCLERALDRLLLMVAGRPGRRVPG